MINIKKPIQSIGENNWISNLRGFLEGYDVETEGLSRLECDFKIPKSMELYYHNFGGIESSDFMYGLYKPCEFQKLWNSDWSFIKDHFVQEYITDFLVFGLSPANDPLCVNIVDESIYLFTHDPIKQSKVFENFDQFLIYEIIEIQKLLDGAEMTKDEEIEYHKHNLSGSDIDYVYRYSKFC